MFQNVRFDSLRYSANSIVFVLLHFFGQMLFEKTFDGNLTWVVSSTQFIKMTESEAASLTAYPECKFLEF